MESQKQALKDLKSRHSAQDGASLGQAQRLKNLAREKTQFEFEGNELSDSINARVQTQSKQTDASYAGLSSGIERILDKDDRLLDGLQAVLPKLEASDEDERTNAEVERLCQALTILSVREVHSRIDSVYASTVASAPPNGVHNDDKEHLVSLRAELDELSSEIDGMVAMVVDNQYRSPISRSLAASQIHAQNERANWTIYITETILHLTARLEALDAHVRHLHAHRAALTQASSAFEAVLASAAANNPSPEKSHFLSPAKQLQKSLKPLRLVQVQGGGKQPSEPHDPAAGLLRHLEVRSSSSAGGPLAADADKLLHTLEQTSRDRMSRLWELEKSTEGAIADQIASSVCQADRDVLDLLRAVYLHSSHGTVQLANGDTQALIRGLEQQTQRLGKAMRGLDTGRIAGEALRLLHDGLR